MKLALSDLAETLEGQLQGADASFGGICTDTRKLRSGDLFVALRGDNFDGHQFLRQAASLGAAGALVDAHQAINLPQVVVQDSLQGLQRFAAAWRGRFKSTVIGVTGSNGKTTVKEMIAAILGQTHHVLATVGNLNNHIGVPLTLLKMEERHDFAVVEMGASHAGEIALLNRLARPSIAVINNAAGAHMEGFGSPEGIARAKGELFADLAADGTAIINADDKFESLWAELAGDRRQLRFGLNVGADISARAIESDGSSTRFRLITPEAEAAVELPLTGRHNVMNALAAAAVTHAAGLPTPEIAYGLSLVKPVSGRLQIRSAALGARIVDDSYNANPASLVAALDTLGHYSGESWLVLGDMGELGAEARAAHEQAGRDARAAGVTRLFAVGPLSAAAVTSFGERGQHFVDQAALIDAIEAELTPGVTVLVKGSRSTGMDRVVTALEAVNVEEGQPC